MHQDLLLELRQGLTLQRPPLEHLPRETRPLPAIVLAREVRAAVILPPAMEVFQPSREDGSRRNAFIGRSWSTGLNLKLGSDQIFFAATSRSPQSRPTSLGATMRPRGTRDSTVAGADHKSWWG
jgi:hypothetical protein